MSVLEFPMHRVKGDDAAKAAFNRYSALQKAWAQCPALANDPRFTAMRDEARAAFRDAFGVS